MKVFSSHISNRNGEVIDLTMPLPEDKLILIKKAKHLSVSLVVPTFNEEATIDSVLDCALGVKGKELIDEIIVVDTGSTDSTIEKVESKGIPFYIAPIELSKLGYEGTFGKGANVWFSQFVTKGDIIMFADADMENPKEEMFLSLLSPIVSSDNKILVKSIFIRETYDENGRLITGGRVTELVVKPALKLFFPELSGIVQPLNGNIAVRREAIAKLALGSKYQVDLQILLGVYLHYGIDSIAQVECGSFRQKGNRINELSEMASQVLKVILETAEEVGRVNLPSNFGRELRFPPLETIRY